MEVYKVAFINEDRYYLSHRTFTTLAAAQEFVQGMSSTRCPIVLKVVEFHDDPKRFSHTARGIEVEELSALREAEEAAKPKSLSEMVTGGPIKPSYTRKQWWHGSDLSGS